MSHGEYEAVRENRLEEIKLSTGITRVMNIVTIKDESHPTQEGKISKGTGVGVPRKGSKGKVLGT